MARQKNKPTKRITALSLLIGAALVILIGAVYVILQPSGNGQGNLAQKQSSGDAPSKPYNSGKMITFVIKKPLALPDLKFKDGTGADRTMADWRGKTVLINLWATWCAPCRHEMPALARLDKALEKEPFDVVAISIDRKGLPASKKFLTEINVAEQLGLYVDPTSRVSQALKVYGLPVSVLVDPQGREIGRLTGPAEWDSPDALRLIRAAMAGRLKQGG